MAKAARKLKAYDDSAYRTIALSHACAIAAAARIGVAEQESKVIVAMAHAFLGFLNGESPAP